MDLQYREPMNEFEMDSIFRLRHAVYSDDEHLHSMVSGSASRDMNTFDINALHYAAFHGPEPIAYIRIATTTETRFTPWVRNIFSRQNISTIKSDHLFPFQQYYPNPQWALGFIESLKGRKIGEVGKLAIHKDYRKGGVVLNRLVAAFVDYCKNEQKFNTGFGVCSHEMERYYRKFGFSIVEGSQPFVSHGLPEAVIVRFDD